MKKALALILGILMVAGIAAAAPRPQLIAARTEQIRENQEERLQTAIQNCNNTQDPESCEQTLQKRLELVSNLQEQDLERLQNIEDRRQEKVNELNLLKEMSGWAKFRAEYNYTARIIAGTILQRAKANYVRAKEQLQTARQNYLTAQNRFRETKKLLQECKSDSEECTLLKEQITQDAKEFLLTAADKIIEHLNTVKANVETNEDLTEEEASRMVHDLDDMIVQVEDAKSVIGTSENKDEIIEAAKTIKNAWIRIQSRLAVYTGRIANAKIGGVIVKTKQLEVKLERILARMEENEIDTSSIQPLIDEFNAKIDDVKSKYDLALEKFKEALDEEDAQAAHDIAVEGHNYIKEAQRDLQDAQHQLRDIVLSIKEQGGEEELSAADDDV
jgi:hypothetical protein